MRKLLFLFILSMSILVGDIVILDCKFHTLSAINQSKAEKLEFKIRIDNATKQAYMEGNNGLNSVVMLPIKDTADTVTFIEKTKTGNVSMTTMHFTKNEDNAVHSRHMSMGTITMYSQYYGHCEMR